ncbi:MAG: hypothetical protein MJ252_23070, partial [archaeon]|nr:hypothetical protein [archaeon]
VFYNPFSFSLNESKSLETLIKNSKNILMIGLDYLPSKVLKQFLFKLTNLEYFNKLNLVFVCNQSIIEDQSNNQNLIKGFCNYLLNGVSFKVDETKESFYEKYETYNLSKLKKEFIIFEFSYKDNKILQFKEIKTYFGDIKNLFEGEVKLIKHDTTFNVQMTEKDLQMKNQVELPYLKGVDEKKENLAIEVDQEDFDEMYEEDPDQDLDI